MPVTGNRAECARAASHLHPDLIPPHLAPEPVHRLAADRRAAAVGERNRQWCSGQTTSPSSIQPCPSGPSGVRTAARKGRPLVAGSENRQPQPGRVQRTAPPVGESRPTGKPPPTRACRSTPLSETVGNPENEEPRTCVRGKSLIRFYGNARAFQSRDCGMRKCHVGRSVGISKPCAASCPCWALAALVARAGGLRPAGPVGARPGLGSARRSSPGICTSRGSPRSTRRTISISPT